MSIPLIALIEDRNLIITSDPKFADCKFAIEKGTFWGRLLGRTIQVAGCIDGIEQARDLSVSNIAEQLKIKPSEVRKQHRAGELFACEDKQAAEAAALSQEVKEFLKKHGDALRKKAARAGKSIHLSKTQDKAPASMRFTPEENIFVHNKPRKDKRINGMYKEYKTAVMIDKKGKCRTVARMVIKLTTDPDEVADDLISDPALREVKILAELQKSEFQERLYGSFINKNKRGELRLTLYVENFPDGSLCSLDKNTDMPKRVEIAKKVIRAVHAFHTVLKMTHNDLKPGNILYNAKTGRIVLTDFGTAEGVSKTERGNRSAGTVSFWSPEKAKANEEKVAWFQKDNKGADVWALGRLLNELIRGSKDDSLPAAEEGNQMEQLISKMLHRNPDKRITIEESLESSEKIEALPVKESRISTPTNSQSSDTMTPCSELFWAMSPSDLT